MEVNMRNENYIEVANNFVKEHHPKAKVAFAAGSMHRGEHKPHSDIDLVVLYDNQDLPEAYRESFDYQGWPIELFCQNANAFAYFIQKDREIAQCVIMHMVASGVIIPESNHEGLKLQEQAKAYIKAGPNPMQPHEIDFERYMISDMVDDLRDERSSEEYCAILSELYNKLGSFYLRANRQWSGKGKALARLLKAYNHDFAKEYQAAFQEGFQNNNIKPVIAIAEKILNPFGGRLWAGYKSLAPKEANQKQQP